MTQGKVWLVGAGPGDAELLTLKALRILQEADVIVYDALVSKEILCLLPEEVRRIYVGKRSGRHAAGQSEINQILLQEAKAGHKVVRLKGGDPFVFGRGGEELMLLAEQGVAFEVVPGITSAVAVPAYAGIPVTHRGSSSSFHVITGHAAGPDTIDYEALVHLHATLIFLMGAGTLSYICEQLIKAGMDAHTPAAMIENGTLPEQREVLATVESLPKKAQQAGLQSPAVIVVGDVASFMESLSWKQFLPLQGKTCVLTRSKEKQAALWRKLKARGARVLLLETMETAVDEKQQKPFEDIVEKMIERTGQEQWVILTSQTDVDAFFTLLRRSQRDIRTLASVRFAVVGSKTAASLHQYGVRADLVPPVFTAEALAEALLKTVEPAAFAYVFKGNRSSAAISQALTAHGICCKELLLYTTRSVSERAAAPLVSAELRRPDTYVLFTSGSCVEGFVQMLDPHRQSDFSQIQAVCIGEKTAQRARQYHMRVAVAKQADTDSMIDLLEELSRK